MNKRSVSKTRSSNSHLTRIQKLVEKPVDGTPLVLFQQNLRKNSTAEDRLLSDIYALIRSSVLISVTEALHRRFGDDIMHNFPNGKEMYQTYKRTYLPVVMFSLHGCTREKEVVVTPQNHTSLMDLDLDNNSKAELDYFARVIVPTNPHIQACGLSVSGEYTGGRWMNIRIEIPERYEDLPAHLQAVIPKDNWLDVLHKLYHASISKDFKEKYTIQVGSTKDLKRGRYLRHNSNLFLNWNAILYAFQDIRPDVLEELRAQCARRERTCSQRQVANSDKETQRFIAILLKVLKTRGQGLFKKYADWFRFACACKYEGVSYADFDAIVRHSAGYDATYNWRIYERIPTLEQRVAGNQATLGTIYHYAQLADKTYLRRLLRKHFQRHTTNNGGTSGKHASTTRL